MKRNTLNKILTGKMFAANNYFRLLLICCLITVFGCKAKKLVITTPVASNITVKPVNDKMYKLEAIKAGQTNFRTFSGRARTKLNINGNSNDVTLNIRVKKDQKIWVSITAIAGIEVARAVITPDSILVINRLQSVYLKKPFSYVNKLAGDQVNYKTVESLLVGNVISELLNESAAIQTNTNNSIITGNLQDLIYKVIIGPGMKSTQTNMSNQGAGESLQVNYSAYMQTGNRVVPSQIDIVSALKDEKIQVNLHYIKTDFDLPLEYPFSIPGRYTPAE